ncbi:12107_t:CDS:2 [Ambispora gerdemannii]|uniref:12107_t:CDS:1 n=1 Tax=Ambispora gerdemannii TaxID=144530 RepID=A0A9N9F719_9GLOM|nr:12107_t:CDS:2 [Ambispora gerdemannii]
MSNDQLTIKTLRKLNSRLASEITELRKENAEIPELRKKFSEEIDQSSVNTTSTEMKNSNDTSASNISDNTSNSDVAPERIENRQQLVQKTSSSSDTQNAISTEINPINEITHDHKTTRLELIPTDQAQNTGGDVSCFAKQIKIPYNRRVEQDLRHGLSVFIKENNNKVSEPICLL